MACFCSFQISFMHCLLFSIKHDYASSSSSFLFVACMYTVCTYILTYKVSVSACAFDTSTYTYTVSVIMKRGGKDSMFFLCMRSNPTNDAWAHFDLYSYLYLLYLLLLLYVLSFLLDCYGQRERERERDSTSERGRIYGILKIVKSTSFSLRFRYVVMPKFYCVCTYQ